MKKTSRKKSQSKRNYEAIGLFILLILLSLFVENFMNDSPKPHADAAVQQTTQDASVSNGLQAENTAGQTVQGPEGQKNPGGAELTAETAGTAGTTDNAETTGTAGTTDNSDNTDTAFTSFTFSIDDIPQYSGAPVYTLNNNQPLFGYEDLTTESFEYYSDLDSLGRCGVCYACVGTDLFPTEERGSISSVKPSGWVVSKYDCVDGKYLYNRCHLLGFQLTGENANKKNLITGTRYLNIQGMLPYENMVHDYVEDTGNHVLYRVTPVFVGDELVARGVTMEAFSVEDEGEELCFYVFAYNVQPGVAIYYADGDNCEDDSTLQYAP